MVRPLRPSSLLLVSLVVPGAPTITAQESTPTPLRQSELTAEAATAEPLTLRDAARNDRWFGLGVRDVRWAPDGQGVFFRWNDAPSSGDVPEEDPWFWASADGSRAREVARAEWPLVPGPDLRWDPAGATAAWSSGGTLLVHDPARGTRPVVTLPSPLTGVRWDPAGEAVRFRSGPVLYEFRPVAGTLAALAVRVERSSDASTEAAAWLEAQQVELFEHARTVAEVADRRAAAVRALGSPVPQAIPVEPGVQLDQIQPSPDGAWVTFRARTPHRQRPPTRYADYLDPSGYTAALEARAKVGEPRDLVRLGVVAVDPDVPVDEIEVRWFDVPDAGDQNTVPHGPLWSPDGARAVAQFIGEDHEDVWIAELDLPSASVRILTHDHDDAWIGGPPVQANYLQPALMEWLPGGDLVFASERTGWSHLYRLSPDGRVEPLTEGSWEVRGARLSRDGGSWLIQASREHPSDDHLYRMPAAGGETVRLTESQGRHEAWDSPDGRRLAVVSSDNTHLPDLWVDGTRVTVSGSDAYYRHPLTTPEIVEFEHPDGASVWAALYRPAEPNAERSALVHIHGGGYRQFAHRGYSVYGYALHLGFIHYMLGQGYTVLDFDYRGSAGFGRDYRTDISESMGIKDTDGAVAGARWLVENEGVDPERIGIYGVSYGGFLTLTSLFRYPGVFGAGVARAAVTDWAHYSDGWTSRVLGLPHENEDAYRLSSPIYYAEGLEDPLLITHGLVDDNVHFQDAARLAQRLIELEKDFDVMVYPVEPHTVQTEASRYDLLRRQARFFDEHLRGMRD